MNPTADEALSLIWLLAGATVAGFAYMVWPALDRRRWGVALELSTENILLGVLSVGLMVQFLGPVIAPMVVVAVMFHEYGHVLAYRLAGHRAPSFRLVPFGGMASSDQPIRSHVENVYISLMGPGFSVALLVLAWMIELALESAGSPLAAVAAFGATIVALLNAFNLLPFYPLDGGHALRAIASAAGGAVARITMLFMSALFLAVALAYGNLILLVIAGFGALATFALVSPSADLPPMRASTAVLAGLAYLATFATHLWAAWPFLATQILPFFA